MSRYSYLLLAQLIWISRSSANLIAQRETVIRPIVVEASGKFEGNDGSWSTFNVSIGTPPQNVRVFPSTTEYSTVVVLDLGCTSDAWQGTVIPIDCDDYRGGTYARENSSTWEFQTHLGNATTAINTVTDIDIIGATVMAFLGFDNITLPGTGGAALDNQLLAAFAINEPLIGLFGLQPTANNITAVYVAPSYMQNLQNKSLIPSLSWGYTAGRSYDSLPGSLTLGGYDKSRFVEHDGSWPIDSSDNLTVHVQAITGSDRGNLLANSFDALIDSSTPYLWVPTDVSNQFEDAFELTYNTTDNLNLYLINDTQHAKLITRNPSVTFTLNGMIESTDSVNITLPYSAFDLSVSSPFVPTSTRYFPLKRQPNGPFILGRTFLQEAFVIADYERGNFSVSPCAITPNGQIPPGPDVVPITPPVAATAATPSNSATPKKSGSSSAGPIAGGAIGGIAVIAALAALIWYFCYLKPKKREQRKTDYVTHGEKTDMLTPAANPALAHDDPHLTRAELGNTSHILGIPELEGSSVAVAGGHSRTFSDGTMSDTSEMPAREETASEMYVMRNNTHEMSTPEPKAETPLSGFPWTSSMTRMSMASVPEGRQQSPSPLGSPGLSSIVSPISGASSPEPLPSPSLAVAHPQPQRVVKPELQSEDSFS